MIGRYSAGGLAVSEARIEVSRAAARPNGAALRPGWLSATRALLAAAVGLAWGGVHGVAAAPLKIAAIGASNTAGWGVGSQKAFPAQLEALLKARGYDAHVVNAGVSGSTTSGMLGRIDSAVPAGTLQPGVNDDLVSRFRSSHILATASDANFGILGTPATL